MIAGCNKLGTKGVKPFAAVLRENRALMELDLGQNTVGAEGARALAEVLSGNYILRVLDLRKC